MILVNRVKTPLKAKKYILDCLNSTWIYQQIKHVDLNKIDWVTFIIVFASIFYLIFNNINDLDLPFYWDTAWFLIPASKLIHETGSILSYLKSAGSDYPHTFLLPLTLSFAFYFTNPIRVIHVLGIIFSIAFLVISWQLSKHFLGKKYRSLILLLIVSNPIFLSQTFLVYFEIIGLALRLFVLKLFLEKKPLAFLFLSIVSVLTRIDSFIEISMLIAFGFFYEKKEFQEKIKWILKYYLPLVLIVITWFVSNKLINGWWLYSPARYYDEKHIFSLLEALRVTFIDQGRYVLSIISIIGMSILFFQNRLRFIFNKKLATLAIMTLPALLMIATLGYLLTRHALPAMIFSYYFLLIILNKIKIKNKFLITIVVVGIISFIQLININNCISPNKEDCLLVKNVIREEIQLNKTQ
jgi:hypothetical protein